MSAAASSPSIPPGAIRIKFTRKREGAGILSRNGSVSQRGEEPIMTETRVAQPVKRQAREASPIPTSETGEPMEIFPGRGVQVSDFPAVTKQKLGRPHSSVLALIAGDRAIYSSELLDERVKSSVPYLENISLGQIQVLSTMSDVGFSGSSDQQEKPEVGSSVCGSLNMIDVNGVVKHFKASEHAEERVYAFPMHADWFSLNTVHRMERQLVPEYFTGKSSERTPKVYMELRNTIVRKYLENPERALSLTDIQGLANLDTKYLSRIFEFLDHWGIINYSATNDPRNNGTSCAEAKEILQENTNGEVQISPGSLRSIRSLIRFDAPRSKFRPADVSVSSGCSTGVIADLDRRIQERLLEHRCTSCSKYCSEIFYQSQKETDVILCSDCFSDGKPVIGMATVDFVRMDGTKDAGDLDGNNWTDQETLLLLEALEMYNDNWNEIAEHVGTKSKAQCILHFIRLPMEDGLLDNIDIPDTGLKSHASYEAIETGKASSLDVKSNGNSAGSFPAELESENRIAFANSSNPVMSLVAFLASAIGPRVAAACAHAALVALSKDDCTAGTIGDSSLHKDGYARGDRLISENLQREDGKQVAVTSSIQQRDHEREDSQVVQAKNDIPISTSSLPAEKVKLAAMAGLSAAALKGKLFADQEEREIQRLAASIVSSQLKRTEIKLKQFGEIESVLSKECEQVEMKRQRLTTERVRLMSSHFGSGGSSTVAAGPVAVSAMNNRPVISSSVPSAPHSGYGSSAHPAFMARPSMFSYGPGGAGSSMPLSTMQSFSGGVPGSVLMGSSAANSTVAHMLRPVTGTNTSTN